MWTYRYYKKHTLAMMVLLLLLFLLQITLPQRQVKNFVQCIPEQQQQQQQQQFPNRKSSIFAPVILNRNTNVAIPLNELNKASTNHNNNSNTSVDISMNTTSATSSITNHNSMNNRIITKTSVVQIVETEMMDEFTGQWIACSSSSLLQSSNNDNNSNHTQYYNRNTMAVLIPQWTDAITGIPCPSPYEYPLPTNTNKNSTTKKTKKRQQQQQQEQQNVWIGDWKIVVINGKTTKLGWEYSYRPSRNSYRYRYRYNNQFHTNRQRSSAATTTTSSSPLLQYTHRQRIWIRTVGTTTIPTTATTSTDKAKSTTSSTNNNSDSMSDDDEEDDNEEEEYEYEYEEDGLHQDDNADGSDVQSLIVDDREGTDSQEKQQLVNTNTKRKLLKMKKKIKKRTTRWKYTNRYTKLVQNIVRDQWNYKGLGISIAKSLLYRNVFGMALRIPITYHWNIFNQYKFLPTIGSSVAIFCTPSSSSSSSSMTSYTSSLFHYVLHQFTLCYFITVSIRIEYIQYLFYYISHSIPTICTMFVVLFLRSIALAVSVLLYPITRNPLLLAIIQQQQNDHPTPIFSDRHHNRQDWWISSFNPCNIEQKIKRRQELQSEERMDITCAFRWSYDKGYEFRTTCSHWYTIQLTTVIESIILRLQSLILLSRDRITIYRTTAYMKKIIHWMNRYETAIGFSLIGPVYYDSNKKLLITANALLSFSGIYFTKQQNQYEQQLLNRRSTTDSKLIKNPFTKQQKFAQVQKEIDLKGSNKANAILRTKPTATSQFFMEEVGDEENETNIVNVTTSKLATAK